MSRYLQRLVARARGTLPVAEPRLPARFEPWQGMAAPADPPPAALASIQPPKPSAAPSPAPPPSPAASPTASPTASPILGRVPAMPAPPRAEPSRYAAPASRPGQVPPPGDRPAPPWAPAATRAEAAMQEASPAPGRGTGDPALPVTATARAVPPAPRHIMAPRAGMAATGATRGAPPEPVVEVTIGRVDVRAVFAAAAPARAAKPGAARPTLEDWLARPGRR